MMDLPLWIWVGWSARQVWDLEPMLWNNWLTWIYIHFAPTLIWLWLRYPLTGVALRREGD